MRGGQEREEERVIYYISRGVGRDANFQARELAGSERRGTTLSSVVLHLFVALLAARKATAFLNSLSLSCSPFNPGKRCKVDRCAHDSSRLVNHRRRATLSSAVAAGAGHPSPLREV